MINIAMDGPAGAGKSTVARAVAGKLGYIYVDTGALYRAVGVNALRCGFDTADAPSVISTLPEINVSLDFIEGEQHVFVNGDDLSVAIRQPEASMAASNVSKIPEVRAFLFDLQRDMAKNNNCIMDGRDIGTVVLPDAQVKIFYTASAEVRARRRFDELKAKGSEVDYNALLKEIEARDYQDSHREIAPLKPAEDSVMLDTSNLNIPQAVDAVIEIVKRKTEMTSDD